MKQNFPRKSPTNKQSDLLSYGSNYRYTGLLKEAIQLMIEVGTIDFADTNIMGEPCQQRVTVYVFQAGNNYGRIYVHEDGSGRLYELEDIGDLNDFVAVLKIRHHNETAEMQEWQRNQDKKNSKGYLRKVA